MSNSLYPRFKELLRFTVLGVFVFVFRVAGRNSLFEGVVRDEVEGVGKASYCREVRA